MSHRDIIPGRDLVRVVAVGILSGGRPSHHGWTSCPQGQGPEYSDVSEAQGQRALCPCSQLHVCLSGQIDDDRKDNMERTSLLVLVQRVLFPAYALLNLEWAAWRATCGIRDKRLNTKGHAHESHSGRRCASTIKTPEFPVNV